MKWNRGNKAGFLLIGLVFLFADVLWAGDKTLTFGDIMRFREIKGAVISDDGQWVAFGSIPDRGDGEGVLCPVSGDETIRVPRGSNPQVSKTGGWAAFVQNPPALEKEKAAGDKKKEKKLKKGVILVRGQDGQQWTWDDVSSFAFSDNGLWFVRLHKEPLDQSADQPPVEEEKESDAKQADKKKKDKSLGSTLILRSLADESEYRIEGVAHYAFDPKSRFLVYALSLKEGKGNGLFYRKLDKKPEKEKTLLAADSMLNSRLEWHHQGAAMAFIQYPKPDEDAKKKTPAFGKLHIWKPTKKPFAVGGIADGWGVPEDNKLSWTRNGERLFFGVKLLPPAVEKEEEKELAEADLFDIGALAEKRSLDVWHGQDLRIKTHARKSWKRENKRTWLSVYHMDSKKTVQLATEQVLDVKRDENPHYLSAYTDLPYRRAVTWDGQVRDFYATDLQTGALIPIAKASRAGSSQHIISPKGGFVAWYEKSHLYLKALPDGEARNLTADLEVSFADEDHDYPEDAPGYGFAGWMEDESGFLAYDKFDIWLFPTNGDQPRIMTQGRAEHQRFRIRKLDPYRSWHRKDEALLLESYNDRAKNEGFYRGIAGKPGTEKLIEDNKTYKVLAKAEKADTILFTREDFREFPDLRVTDLDFSDTRKLTDENPQIKDFSWGTPELVSWRSSDGKQLQGVLIKPDGFREGEPVPVLVYFYRFMSQRLYRFNQMVVNHRPNLPFYASNGYAVFLPDVRFAIGTPGHSAVQALVPGIQKLVDMGVADPNAIGLHGHSWSGYQAAYIVTQTNIFTCVITGAPVSNMTSAYSGIRLGSGMARQFQYEQQQSRIGATLWERRDLYIDNSPVFFADRIETPMLIQFGDIDDAVPWHQGVELYLAMRRLDKDVVFLQYRGEPHHLKKYPNKVDYSVKMKEYLDHYLKGEPAPEWITEGVPYKGD